MGERETCIRVPATGDPVAAGGVLSLCIRPWTSEMLGIQSVGSSHGLPGEAYKLQGSYPPRGRANDEWDYEDLHFQEIGEVLVDTMGEPRPARSLVREFSLALFPEYSPRVDRLTLRVTEATTPQELLLEVCLRAAPGEPVPERDLEWWRRRVADVQADVDALTATRRPLPPPPVSGPSARP